MGEGTRGQGDVLGDHLAVEVSRLAVEAHAVGLEDALGFGVVEVDADVGEQFKRGAVDDIERFLGGQLVDRQPVHGLYDAGNLSFSLTPFARATPPGAALSSLSHTNCLLTLVPCANVRI